MMQRPAMKAVSFEDKLARDYIEAEDRIARGVAAEMGPAPDSEAAAEAEQLEHWKFRDPQQDVMQLIAMVDAGQMTPTQATLTLYPRRGDLILHVAGPDPEDQIRYARKMRRLAERSLTPDDAG